MLRWHQSSYSITYSNCCDEYFPTVVEVRWKWSHPERFVIFETRDRYGMAYASCMASHCESAYHTKQIKLKMCHIKINSRIYRSIVQFCQRVISRDCDDEKWISVYIKITEVTAIFYAILWNLCVLLALKSNYVQENFPFFFF